MPAGSTSAVVTRLTPTTGASVRTHVKVPLQLADGTSTTADVFTFDHLIDQKEHLVLGLGEWQSALSASETGGEPLLVRMHSECLTGDVFGSDRCDCGAQLTESLAATARTGGLVLYLRQEGRGIGLYAKLDAYALQDQGLDTYEANVALGHGEDERSYEVAAQMLEALGVERIRLLSNNPDKQRQLERHGIVVAERIATGVYLSPANAAYLQAKLTRTGHTLTLP